MAEIRVQLWDMWRAWETESTWVWTPLAEDTTGETLASLAMKELAAIASDNHRIDCRKRFCIIGGRQRWHSIVRTTCRDCTHSMQGSPELSTAGIALDSRTSGPVNDNCGIAAIEEMTRSDSDQCRSATTAITTTTAITGTAEPTLVSIIFIFIIIISVQWITCCPIASSRQRGMACAMAVLCCCAQP